MADFEKSSPAAPADDFDDDLFTSPSVAAVGGSTSPSADGGADDLFDAPADQGGLDAMLAGPEDDDLFESPADAAPETPSALVAWEREKRAELDEKDAADSALADATRSAASQALSDWFEKLHSGQAKRAQHNKEADAAKIEDLDQDVPNRWEKVVKSIDFTRADLHIRDVARMKSLLLQLKQSDRK
jgi:hypothetical protein